MCIRDRPRSAWAVASFLLKIRLIIPYLSPPRHSQAAAKHKKESTEKISVLSFLRFRRGKFFAEPPGPHPDQAQADHPPLKPEEEKNEIVIGGILQYKQQLIGVGEEGPRQPLSLIHI